MTGLRVIDKVEDELRRMRDDLLPEQEENTHPAHERDDAIRDTLDDLLDFLPRLRGVAASTAAERQAAALERIADALEAMNARAVVRELRRVRELLVSFGPDQDDQDRAAMCIPGIGVAIGIIDAQIHKAGPTS